MQVMPPKPKGNSGGGLVVEDYHDSPLVAPSGSDEHRPEDAKEEAQEPLDPRLRKVMNDMVDSVEVSLWDCAMDK